MSRQSRSITGFLFSFGLIEFLVLVTLGLRIYGFFFKTRMDLSDEFCGITTGRVGKSMEILLGWRGGVNWQMDLALVISCYTIEGDSEKKGWGGVLSCGWDWLAGWRDGLVWVIFGKEK